MDNFIVQTLVQEKIGQLENMLILHILHLMLISGWGKDVMFVRLSIFNKAIFVLTLGCGGEGEVMQGQRFKDSKYFMKKYRKNNYGYS